MATTKVKVFAGPVRKARIRPKSDVTRERISLFSVNDNLSKSIEDEIVIKESLDPITSIKRVDFVLVYKKSDINDNSLRKMETFLSNLEDKGFELDSATFSLNNEINFIKIHAPDHIAIKFSEIFGIELAFQNVTKINIDNRSYRFMTTPLTKPDVNNLLYQRAKDTLSGKPPRSITNAEKGFVIHKVLTKNKYGNEKHEFGVQKLINNKIFECVYPLHDGTEKWTNNGPLNDRQLLARYWSSFLCWYKQQPLDLIERYYGPETGFYFAWAGFYIKMLIPASIAGITFFLLGLVSFHHLFLFRSKEVCDSDMLLCPRCLRNCKYEPLHNSCYHANMIYFFDNPMVITFAALMSVWSTVFLELWIREEAVLQIRWNLRSVETDFSMRLGFEERATHWKLSPITGVLEPYMSKTILCYRYTVTVSVMLLLVLLMIMGIFGVMIYVKTVRIVLSQISSKKRGGFNVGVFASISGSLMSLLFIYVFEAFYTRTALWLTKMENPRTQVDFDNSFTYKSYAMAFVNYYCVTFYIAFFKARFYTYPGDASLWIDLGGLKSDLCEPSGCIMELGIQLTTVLLRKKLIMIAKQYLIPQIKIFVRKLRKKKKVKVVEVTEQWEKDYLLHPVGKYQIMKEYMSMIIQYGFVTFFVAAFPPAPLLALLTNIIELRVDAAKMTGIYRRPVAIKIPNLAAWHGILRGATYIGVLTNAFVIAFTSEFVQRSVYQHYVRYDLKGYVNSTLSVYNVSEYTTKIKTDENVTICYYPGKRHPPDHPNRYELTDDYWFDMAMKFLTVVIFEHVVLLVTGVIAFVIPDIPFSVKEHINYQKDQIKEIKLKSLQNTYSKKKRDDKTDVFGDTNL